MSRTLNKHCPPRGQLKNNMKLVDYINSLIENGTWSKLSSEAQSILLLIHARYKGEPLKLSYRVIQESTGVSKSIVKSKLLELVDAGLIEIDPKTKAIKPTVDVSDEGLPIPPGDPDQDSGEYIDLLEWVREWVATPWGAALGGAVLYYLIKLWLEYIKEQQKASDPFHDWPTFVAEASTVDYGLTSTLRLLDSSKLEAQEFQKFFEDSHE